MHNCRTCGRKQADELEGKPEASSRFFPLEMTLTTRSKVVWLYCSPVGPDPRTEQGKHYQICRFQQPCYHPRQWWFHSPFHLQNINVNYHQNRLQDVTHHETQKWRVMWQLSTPVVLNLASRLPLKRKYVHTLPSALSCISYPLKA